MILYPTDTIYGLGVNALDEAAIRELYALKGRDEGKGVSWLVRDIEDIAQYGELTEAAAKIAEQFLPGALTLVLKAKDTVPAALRGPEDSVSCRIVPDPVTQQVLSDFMYRHNAPLTATSANVSGEPTLETPQAILQQFADHGSDTSVITEVVDDGPRTGTASTVVRVFGEQVEILREGAIPARAIIEVVDGDML